MKTIEEVVARMPEAKVFSVLDATSGYWQMKLNEDSSKLYALSTHRLGDTASHDYHSELNRPQRFSKRKYHRCWKT
jgi:hypothetical protein